MELIKLTKTMEKELHQLSEVYEERVGYLTYTRNYYYLEDDKGSYITSEPVTLKALNAYLKGESYAVSVLDKEEAEQALSKKTKPRRKVATSPKKKETPAQDKKEPETKDKKKSESKDEKETELKDDASSDSDE